MLLAAPASGQGSPVVHAVLFFSPTCPHCEYVINEVLPGLFEANGGTATLYWDPTLPEEEVTFYLASNGSLEILLADVTLPDGATLFESASAALDIESAGVPRLVVGDRYLIGSGEIPDLLPDIVADARETGTGIDWPVIPGLAEALAATAAATTSTTLPGTTTSTPTTADAGATATTATEDVLPLRDETTPWERFRRDPIGNTLALVVLAIMAVAVVATIRRLRNAETPSRRGLEIPLLAVIGIAIAGYLTYIEIGGNTAVCGPVGDCNTVQQSEYARLFGVIPIGILGIAGYALILVSWLAAHRTGKHSAQLTVVGFAVASGGVLFSAYLTFLEPFVIGATCAWCLGSALTITFLMWVSGPPARSAWRRMRIRAF